MSDEIGTATPTVGVALLHADGTACQHDGKPQATVSDDGGPLCPAGQPVTHIRYNGRLLTIEEASAAFSSMAETITTAIAPFAAALAELGRKITVGPHVRALAAAAEVIEEETGADIMTDGQFFIVERDQDGQVVDVTPVTGRVDRAGDGYIVREPQRPRPPLSTLMFHYDFRPEPVTFGTYVSPTRFIPLKEPDEIRREAAEMVLAVFRELGVDPQHPEPAGSEADRGRVQRLKREPWPLIEDPGPLDALRLEYEFPFPPRGPSRRDPFDAIPVFPPLPWPPRLSSI